MGGACCEACRRARCITLERSSWVISSYSTRDLARRRAGPATFDCTSLPIWPRSGQAAVVSATFTVTSPSGLDRRCRAPCPRSTIEARSSGSRTPASMLRTSSGLGGGRAGRSWAGRVADAGSSPNKTSVDLENMPDPGVPSRKWTCWRCSRPRRRDPLLDVPGARRLDPRLLGAGARRLARPARQHRPAAPRAPARGRPGRRRARAPGHRRPAARTSTRWRRARPAWVSTRRATRCSPGCSPRSPSGSAPTATRPPRSAARGASKPAAAPARARA